MDLIPLTLSEMFLIFDTETTGLPKRDNAPVSEVDNWPRVVQIAWQMHDESGGLTAHHNVLIRPDGFEIPYSAEKVHGISTEKAKTEGVPLEEALSIFNKSLKQCRVLIGHNIRFDMNALGAEFIRSGVATSFLDIQQVCTMHSSTDYLKLSGGRGGKFKAPKLIELYEFLFDERFSEAHNAAADVEATARCFFELLRLKVISPESIALSHENYETFIHKNQGKVKAIGLSHTSNRESPSREETSPLTGDQGNAEMAPDHKPEEIQSTGEEKGFCHLHVHTQYSILDGAASIPSLLKKAIDDGMRAVAITDHGNMFGVKEFHNEATKRGIKPIIGCEAYIARRSRHTKEDKNLDAVDHIVLLAKNHVGYKNLTTMVSLGWTEGFYYKPRIDRELLEKYKEGMICLSACLGGEIPQAIMHKSVEDAEKVLIEYKRIFGADFYLEMKRHRTDDPGINKLVFDDQVFVNRTLLELGKKHGIKCVASNDVHFVDMDDAEAHDHLICLNTGRDLDDPKRMRYTRQEWFKTQAEMRDVFSDHPQVLMNTLEVAAKVEQYELNSNPVMPFYPLPEDFKNEDEYLKHLTYEGAKLRYESITDEIRERIDFELGTIQRMGFPGYFLIVQDFIAAARKMGVSVGPGRGSAAGSAVAYCLKITDIDPIRYDLLFERFLNPDRISMPDIDIDFDEDGREEVLQMGGG